MTALEAEIGAFVVREEEEILPAGIGLEDGVEEERRLMYVGITRARESLTLSFAGQRRRFGEQVKCAPSRFLDELPEELLEWKGRDEEKDFKRTKERATAHLDALRDMFSD